MEEKTMDYSDHQVKHLEILQGVIGRMAEASMKIKRLAIIIVGGAVAIIASPIASTISLTTYGTAVLGFLLTGIFWYMDAKNHQYQRWFRAKYDHVCGQYKEGLAKPDFKILPEEEEKKKRDIFHSLLSWSTWPLYTMLVIFWLVACWIVQWRGN